MYEDETVGTGLKLGVDSASELRRMEVTEAGWVRRGQPRYHLQQRTVLWNDFDQRLCTICAQTLRLLELLFVASDRCDRDSMSLLAEMPNDVKRADFSAALGGKGYAMANE